MTGWKKHFNCDDEPFFCGMTSSGVRSCVFSATALFPPLQVHRKLTERDAEEYMKSNNGVFLRRNSMTTAQSILDLIRSQSECSLDSV